MHPISSSTVTMQTVTRYEYAKLMGMRVTALATNVLPAINEVPRDSVGSLLQIAESEFVCRTMPLTVVRRFPAANLDRRLASELRKVRTYMTPQCDESDTDSS